MRLAPSSNWSSGDIELFVLTPDLVTDAYIAWLADPEVGRFLESRFREHKREDVEAFVAQILESPSDLLLGIRSLELQRHVGNIKLGPINRDHGLGEIGIMIGDRQAWGRGIASEAIRCLSRIAQLELGLRKLSAGCYASNVGSRKAFEKAGFVVEGIRPQHSLLDGKPEDVVLLGQIIGKN